MPSPLADPVKLPCGLVLPNRLSKVCTPPFLRNLTILTTNQAAMAEMMAKTNHPTDPLLDAYSQWSEGGWGSILTGKKQTQPHSLPNIHNRNLT
jgi:2,4-dienoyl-CoA reductase-like NADH-dependent reductase (Old Yellow Enzyme family)